MFSPLKRSLAGQSATAWKILAARPCSISFTPAQNPHKRRSWHDGAAPTIQQQLLLVRNFSASSMVRATEATAVKGASTANATTQAAEASSSAASNPDELVVDFVIPDRPVPLAEQVQQLAETGQSLAEPTLQSLGLASWWPSGLMQSLMEQIHLVGDIPWWGTIVITTIGIRTVVFPLVVFSQKNSARINNHAPGMQKITEAMTEARKRGDHYEAQRLGAEMQQYYKKYNLNPLKNFAPMALQLPIFMSMFFGLRGMTNLPVESMETGGALWFTNLAVADPFYLLPIITSATMFLQLKFAVDGMQTDQLGPKGKMLMKAMPLLVLFFTHNFPAALTWYWAVTNGVTLIQAWVIKREPVRAALGIPKFIHWEKTKMGKKKKKDSSFIESVRETWDDMKVSSDIADRRIVDEEQFRKAGLSKPKKTYKFDPTTTVVKPVRRK